MPRSRSARRRTIRRLIIVACIAGLLGATAAVLHTGNTIQTNRMVADARERGLAAYTDQNYPLAIRHLSIYNARIPGDAEVTLALAQATSNLPDLSRDDTAAAAAFALTATGLMPGNIEPVLIEIEMRRRLGQHTELLAAADRALGIDDTNADASAARVQALAALGRREEALRSALEFAERVPDQPEPHRLVLVMLTGLDPATASTRVREYAETLAEDHPDDPRFIILSAQAFAQVRAFDRATEAAERLLEPQLANQLDAAALADATQLLDILGRRDAAEELLQGFIERAPGAADVAAISIERAYQQGRIDLAAERARTALTSADQITPTLRMWARLADVEADAPTEGFAGYIVRGLDALAANDPASAARDFDRARSLDPSRRVAHHLVAVALDRLGNPAEAARVRERLLRTAPTYTVARLAHIRALLDQRRANEAAAFARLGLQLDQSSGGLALALVLANAERAATGQATRGEISQAISIAGSLEGDTEQATPATPPLARLLIAAGRTDEAEQAIERLIEANYTDAAALLALARDARDAGLPAASDLLALAERHAATNAQTLLAVATAMHDEGRTDDALTLINNTASQQSDQRSIALAQAVFLDRIASAEAPSRFVALFEQAPTDPGTLTVILESQAAWSDDALIRAAVTSLQDTTADTSDTWRFYEARRLLTFEVSDAQAAEAVRLLEPLASSASSSPRVSVLLAEALLRLGDTNAALGQLAVAADTGLDDPSLLLRLGWLHNAQGDIESARRRARAVAQIDPIEPPLRRERIALLATVGLLDQASEDASVLEATGNARDIALAASIAARAGDTEALGRRLAALEASSPLPAPVLAVTGDLLVRTGEVTRAFELLERNRPAADEPGFARAEAAVLLAAQQQNRAIQRLTDAYRLTGAPTDAARAAQTLASAGQTAEAITLIDQALASAPDDITLTTLRSAIELDNVALSAAGDNIDAATRTIAALKRQIDNPSDTDRFLDDLRWVTTVSPTYYPAWALLTDGLRQLGRVDEAADTAASAMRLMPTDPRPARLAVGAMVNLEPATRALGAAREWQARSMPDTYEADTTAAALLVRLGRIDEASALLAQWADRIEGDPAVPPVLFRIYASALITSDRADTAAELFERRRTTDPRWAGHQIEVTRDLIQYHDAPDLARDWLALTANVINTDADLALRTAQAAVDLADRTGEQADLDAAIAAAQTAQRASTPATERAAALLLAQAYRYANNPKAAADLARALAEADPADPVAHVLNALATVEADGDPNEARNAAQRAIDIADTDALRLDALGRAQLFAGDAEAAEQSFRRAISSNPNKPSPRVGLAEALTALDRPGDARRVIRDPLLRRDVERHALLRERVQRLREATRRQ